jgi:hypothetical protein
VPEPKRKGNAEENEERATKESGVRSRTDSEMPTLRPSEVRAPLPADPEEAARDPRVSAMRELYAAGDVNAALFIAATIDSAPMGFTSRDAETLPPPTEQDDDDTRQLRLDSGASTWVPQLRLAREEIAILPIDHRAGFLLAHVDGTTTLGEIFDVCAMPEGEAMALVDDLVRLGVITLS